MKIANTLLAMGLAGLVATAANAQSIADIGGIQDENPGDLILGFTNPSTSSEMLVDVGPASNYYSTSNALAGESSIWNATSETPLTPGDTYTVGAFSSSTLNSVFGSNAYSSSTQWAVVGGNGNDGGPGNEPNQTLWLTSSGSLTSTVQASQGGLSGQLDTMTNSAVGGTQVGGSSSDAVTQSKTNSTSFTQLMGNGNFNFNQGSLTATTAALSSGGTSSLTLWELVPTNANTTGGAATVDLGTFTLSSTGLTFTAFAAIPEPSTYAAILGALTVGFVLIRRRTQASGFNTLA